MRIAAIRLTTVAALGAALLSPPAHAAVTCFGDRAEIKGTTGSDVIEGTSGADVIAGLGGADHIIGLGGNDKICGAGGEDVLSGGEGNDKIAGGDADDSVSGGAGADNLSGNDGDDMLAGNAGEDEVFGNAGSDMLNGGADPDHLDGGTDPGAERPDVDTSVDHLDGGSTSSPGYPYGNHCHNAESFPSRCDYVGLEVDVEFDHFDDANDLVHFTVDLQNNSFNHPVVTAHDIWLRGNGNYVSGGPASCGDDPMFDNGWSCRGFRLASNTSIETIHVTRPYDAFGTSVGATVSSADFEFYTDDNQDFGYFDV